MVVDFATKLRMTAAVLGCTRHKELCSRFQQINPATQCTLDRMQKWMQGRSLPRSSIIYEDWARLLGSQHSGSWLASCAVGEFASELAALFGVERATLLAGDQAHGGTRARSFDYLAGTYLCYSPAWSPYQAGNIIRGRLTVGAGHGTGLAVRYAEVLMGQEISFVGDATVPGRSIGMLLREVHGSSHIAISAYVPGPPAGALCGVMSGITIFGSEPRPAAGRVLAIRLPAALGERMPVGYMEAQAGSYAADLLGIGLDAGAAMAADALIRRFLNDGEGLRLDFVTAADHGEIGTFFDGAIGLHAA